MNLKQGYKTIVVLGASGLLGKSLAAQLGGRCLPLTRREVDLAQPTHLVRDLDAAVNDLDIAAVVNCGAYTRVDQAENEEGLAMVVNAVAPGVLARWCLQRGIPLVHLSTDYVFPGTGQVPWREEDPMTPLNAYGRTKAEGDRRIAAAGGQWLIFRPTWVYGGAGKSFFTSMLARAREQEVLRVVDDQHGAPTYAAPLGQAMLLGLERAQQMPEFPAGVYHLCHGGETTWYDFCCAIIEAARTREMSLAVKQIEPVSTQFFGAPARRPLNSRLDTQKAQRILGLRLPHWQVGFEECVRDVLGEARAVPSTS